MAIAYCGNCQRFYDHENPTCAVCASKTDVSSVEVFQLNLLNSIASAINGAFEYVRGRSW